MTTDEPAVDGRDAPEPTPGEPTRDDIERLFGSLPTIRVSRLSGEK
ncbi:hypothetical protein [Halorussus sp. AFM4]